MGTGNDAAAATVVQPGPGVPDPRGILCWPALVFDRRRVVELDAPASCWTAAGDFWEFDEGRFFVTGAQDRGRRRPVESAHEAPDGPWVHAPDCDCPACRVAPGVSTSSTPRR